MGRDDKEEDWDFPCPVCLKGFTECRCDSCPECGEAWEHCDCDHLAGVYHTCAYCEARKEKARERGWS